MWDHEWDTAEFGFENYEWDREKARINRAKHRAGFEEATEIFGEEVLVRREIVEGEERCTAIGALGFRFLTVVFTERGRRCRIISARKATPSERRRHRAHFGG